MQTRRVHGEADLARLGRQGDVRGLPHDDELTVFEPADHVSLVAERLDHGDRRLDRPALAEVQVLGTHAQHDVLQPAALDRSAERSRYLDHSPGDLYADA